MEGKEGNLDFCQFYFQFLYKIFKRIKIELIISI